MDWFTLLPSPFGTLRLVARADRLVRLDFASSPRAIPLQPGCRSDPGPFRAAARQLDEYFARARRSFDLPLAFEGATLFERSVWERLLEIPYGETISYAALARGVGRPRAVRAAAGANARNPISIVVPCHRVVARDGSLRGYAGGAAVKARLLALERGEGPPP
jgi:O-6-methylguanine DNA methyltransferase